MCVASVVRWWFAQRRPNSVISPYLSLSLRRDSEPLVKRDHRHRPFGIRMVISSAVFGLPSCIAIEHPNSKELRLVWSVWLGGLNDWVSNEKGKRNPASRVRDR